MLLPGLCFLLLTIGYPVSVLFLQSFFPDILGGSLGGFFSAYLRIFQTEGIPTMLWNSLLWGISTMAGAWILGIPCGYLLARTDLAGKRFARLMLLIPVMSPAYITALAYILVMQPGGFADILIGGLPFFLRSWFFSFWGVTFVMAVASFGAVALAVEAALRAISTRLEDAAASLGATWWQTFRVAVLPLLLPAILNSGILVFLDALSNFGVPAIMGPRANLPLLPAEIYHLITSWPIDLPLATALSVLLCIVAVALLSLSRILLRSVGQGRTRTPVVVLKRLEMKGQLFAWLWLTFVFIISSVIPVATVVATSFVGRWGVGQPEWTLENYSSIFQWGSEGMQALLTSAGLGVVTATVCVLVGGVAAYALARHRGALASFVDGLGVLPRVIPRIVTAVALIMAWNAPWVLLDIYNTLWILLLAYFALYQSDALRFGDSGMRQIGLNLEHAATCLGASKWQTLRRVVMPLLGPSLFAAWMTTFVVCMRDWVASIILLPPGVQTVGSFIFNQFDQGRITSAMAMAACTVLLSSAVLIGLQLRRR